MVAVQCGLAACQAGEVQIAGDDRRLEAHRLEVRDAEGLQQRGHEQGVAVLVVRRDLVMGNPPQRDEVKGVEPTQGWAICWKIV